MISQTEFSLFAEAEQGGVVKWKARVPGERHPPSIGGIRDVRGTLYLRCHAIIRFRCTTANLAIMVSLV